MPEESLTNVLGTVVGEYALTHAMQFEDEGEELFYGDSPDSLGLIGGTRLSCFMQDVSSEALSSYAGSACLLL